MPCGDTSSDVVALKQRPRRRRSLRESSLPLPGTPGRGQGEGRGAREVADRQIREMLRDYVASGLTESGSVLCEVRSSFPLPKSVNPPLIIPPFATSPTPAYNG